MTTGQMIMLIALFTIGILLTIAAAWSLGRAYAIQHYEKAQKAIGRDYIQLSKEFEKVAREMQRSDQMRAGINLGQESVLHEFENLTAHMRKTLDERMAEWFPDDREEVTDG